MKKKILILGGTSDIGIAIAQKFAARKFEVWLAGRDEDYLSRIASDIRIRKNVEVNYSVFNAADFQSHEEFYSSIPIETDVCVCVFGYLGDQQLAEVRWEEANQIVDSNYTGAVSILNIVAADYEERKSGSIIGVSSVAGDRGRQSNYIYGSAKAGFTAFLSGLRNKLFKKGVHVMTVKPGFVETQMTSGLNLPPLLTVTPEVVAASVFRAYSRRSNVIYISPLWWFIMKIITSIPEFVFKRMKL